MKYRQVFNMSIVLLWCFLFSACSSTVSIKINNIENSNLNNRSDDVPVTIVVYKLNNIEKFIDSSDKDLITREDGALGKDKIDSMKLQIAPKNEIIALKIKDKEVPYIGILALFANDALRTTKVWVKTKKVKGLRNKKVVKFEITQEGIKRIYGVKYGK
ncbi:type VI secretion system lipoprotein TssJ [Helicobacter sp. T3_23-1059]